MLYDQILKRKSQRVKTEVINEALVLQKILKYLRSLPNCLTIRVNGATTRGIPDIVVCYKKRFLGLEVKPPHRYAKGLSRIQFNILRTIKACGGAAFCVCDVEQVKRIVQAVDENDETFLNNPDVFFLDLQERMGEDKTLRQLKVKKYLDYETNPNLDETK